MLFTSFKTLEVKRKKQLVSKWVHLSLSVQCSSWSQNKLYPFENAYASEDDLNITIRTVFFSLRFWFLLKVNPSPSSPLSPLKNAGIMPPAICIPLHLSSSEIVNLPWAQDCFRKTIWCSSKGSGAYSQKIQGFALCLTVRLCEDKWAILGSFVTYE